MLTFAKTLANETNTCHPQTMPTALRSSVPHQPTHHPAAVTALSAMTAIARSSAPRPSDDVYDDSKEMLATDDVSDDSKEMLATDDVSDDSKEMLAADDVSDNSKETLYASDRLRSSDCTISHAALSRSHPFP